jgi:hypothetical protein
VHGLGVFALASHHTVGEDVVCGGACL